MRVIVVGAGIGGLALGQALVRQGVDVSVHDRDPDLSVTGGYRLHLDHRACAALRRHLSPVLHQALLGSSADARTFRRFSVTDHRLNVLFAEDLPAGEERLLVGRVPLRRLLTHGLGDALVFGSEFTHHETLPDGRVAACFADGRREVGDLLVGADGVGSRVASALAGRPTSRPTGLGGIAARTRLTPSLRAVLPAVLDSGAALAFAPDGLSSFLHVHDPVAGTAIDPAVCVDVPADVEPADLVWGVHGPAQAFPADVRTLDAEGLRRVTADLLHDWHPALRTVTSTPPRTIGWFRFHAADPGADLTPWPSGTVTALGDAVHAMPPTGGQAAATAILDADLLATELAAVRAGTSTIPLAVHAYERAMPGHALPALRTSLAPLAWQRRLSRPGTRPLAQAALTTLAAAHRVRHGRST